MPSGRCWWSRGYASPAAQPSRNPTRSDVIANQVKGLLRNFFTLSKSHRRRRHVAGGGDARDLRQPDFPPARTPDDQRRRVRSAERTVPSGLYQSSATPETSFSGLVVDLTKATSCRFSMPVVAVRGKDCTGPGTTRAGAATGCIGQDRWSRRSATTRWLGPPARGQSHRHPATGIALGDADAEQVFAADAGSQFLAE